MLNTEQCEEIREKVWKQMGLDDMPKYTQETIKAAITAAILVVNEYDDMKKDTD